MSKILIIEDDTAIGTGLVKALEKVGFSTVLATDGERGLHEANVCRPDLIIMDIMMPAMNGFEVTTEIRRLGHSVPIIVLSARSATADKIRGLNLGADDYLTKPFDIDELVARINRKLKVGSENVIYFGKYSFDCSERLARNSLTQEIIDFLPKELLIVEYMISRPNRLISRDMIINHVWGDDYDGTDRTVDNYIVGIRKKLGQGYILTIRGQGYRFICQGDNMVTEAGNCHDD
jgi:DNA-binding response OmpR family regulator